MVCPIDLKAVLFNFHDNVVKWVLLLSLLCRLKKDKDWKVNYLIQYYLPGMWWKWHSKPASSTLRVFSLPTQFCPLRSYLLLIYSVYSPCCQCTVCFFFFSGISSLKKQKVFLLAERWRKGYFHILLLRL